MKSTHALIFALAQRYLKELIPGEWQSELAEDFAEAEQAVTQDEFLRDWIDHKIAWFETWQGLLKAPEHKGGVLHGISMALFNGQQLRIKYQRGDDTKTYIVHPLGLVKRDEVIYLVATAGNYDNPLFLSLHRIVYAWPQDAPSRKPTDFDLHEFLKHGWPFEFKENEEKTLDIELLFHDAVYHSMRDRPLQGAEIHQPEDGWFKVTGQVPNTMELRWWLLGFNDKVFIQKPESLANELQNTLYDQLTGLLQRRAIQEHLDRWLAVGQRREAPLALIMVDIDHFKKVNDTHGHSVGDTVLKEVARRLKQHCREMDMVGRWGGEEFMIILPDAAETKALDIAGD